MSPTLKILVAATLLTAALLGPLSAASAGTVTRTDPQGDVDVARADILQARVTFNDRVTVRTHFRSVRPGTSYFTFVDPARRGVGPVFRLFVRVRHDFTVGRLERLSQNGPVVEPCGGLRTSLDFDRDNLRISVPSPCLRRFAPLGRGIWVNLNSLGPTPEGPSPAVGDLLPNDPSGAFRVPRG